MTQVAYKVYSLSIIGQRPNADVVHELEDLLSKARAGTIQGLALIAFQGARDYKFHVVGVVENRPTYVLGAVTKFKHDISEQIGG